MQVKACLATILLSNVLSINAAPWSVNGATTSSSLSKRGDSPSVNQPITDAEWENLKAAGLGKRSTDTDTDESAALVARDYTMNCGHLVTGKGGSNGHGKWVPVYQFETLAREFCNAYSGTDVAKNHETSDSYPATFSNGKSGYIVFAIYNTAGPATWTWDSNTCFQAMKGPLGDNAKRDVNEIANDANAMVKRDNCYGTNHDDYEGGYYSVDGIGAIGSEMYAN